MRLGWRILLHLEVAVIAPRGPFLASLRVESKMDEQDWMSLLCILRILFIHVQTSNCRTWNMNDYLHR
jgi:hypothetical protein